MSCMTIGERLKYLNSNFSFMKLTDSSIEKLRNSITFLEASSELMVLISEDNSDIFKISRVTHNNVYTVIHIWICVLFNEVTLSRSSTDCWYEMYWKTKQSGWVVESKTINADYLRLIFEKTFKKRSDLRSLEHEAELCKTMPLFLIFNIESLLCISSKILHWLLFYFPFFRCMSLSRVVSIF